MSKGIVYEYEDGGTYCGEWEKDSSHGYGCGTGPGGRGRYEGLWEQGGQVSGVYTWPNGMKYMGSWKNNRRDGLGKEVRQDGTEYCGEFIRGARGPYGVTRLPTGVYKGSWRNGKQDGEGEEVYLDGGCYRGQYKNGMRSGFGSRTSAAYERRGKDKTTGSITKDSSSSVGGAAKQRNLSSLVAPLMPPFKRTSLSIASSNSTSALPGVTPGGGGVADAISSSASSNNIATQAETSEQLASMQIYEGEWRDDKRHGYGVIKCIGSYTYYGQWCANARTGYGVLVGENGVKEEGQWQNGQLLVALKRKKLHIKSHQLETKVQTAHTQAIQAADTARNKALLAESRAATASGKAKMALGVVASAMKNAQLAREKAELYKHATKISEGVKSPMTDIRLEFPIGTSPPLTRARADSRLSEDTSSLGSQHLDVGTIPHTPSCENLQYFVQTQHHDSDEDSIASSQSGLFEMAVDRRKRFSSNSSGRGSHGSSSADEELQWKRNDFAKHASVSEQTIPVSPLSHAVVDDAHRRISEGGNRARTYNRPPRNFHPLHRHEVAPVMEGEEEDDEGYEGKGEWQWRDRRKGVVRRKRRSIDKTTDGMVGPAGEVKDCNTDDEMPSTEDRPLHKPATFKKNSSSVDMLMQNLNQMANWNKMIAYVNFFLLVFLMVLILIVVISMNYYQLASYYHDHSQDDQSPSASFSPIA